MNAKERKKLARAIAHRADSMEAAQKIVQDNKLYTYPICRIEVTGFKAA
ncbi:TPA: hypothetical protein U5E34_002446 [Yersinia enterocolitica]|nr:hypothetical protein [Yersinia enterocolitica]